MKQLTQIVQVLLGVVALILTALIAFGRLAWRIIRSWWKNNSKWLRRSIVATVIIIPVAFVAFLAYAYYDSEYGRYTWEREWISTNVELHSYRDGTYRLYNIQTREYTTPKINWVSEASEEDSLVVYALPYKRGYINIKNGEIIIDAKLNDYSRAWVFSEGLAAVEKDGKIGFINSDNEVVIPFQFDYSDMYRMAECSYLFHNGYCVMTNAEGDLGLIDRMGNWVVEPQYDQIWKPHESGYRVILKGGKYGVIDSQCSLVYPTEYLTIDIISDGFVLAKGGFMWQVNFEGETVIPFMYDCRYDLCYPIGYTENEDIEYALSDYVQYQVAGRLGIMNRRTGQVLTPAIYSDIRMLSDVLFEVQRYDTYEWYVLDINGNMVIR